MEICKNCGAPLKDGDRICPNCRSRRPQPTRPKEAPAAPKKRVSGLKAAAVVLTALVLGFSLHAFLGGRGDKPETQDPPTPTVPTTASTAPYHAPETAPPETTLPPETLPPVTVELESYLGDWYVDGSPERVLTIHSWEERELTFTLFYYRVASFDNVAAEISGNTATFSADNGVKGTLTFLERGIAVEITESRHDYVAPEAMLFNTREEILPTEPELDIFTTRLLPDAASRIYTEAEIMERIRPWVEAGYTTGEALMLARNEIYANHSYAFQDDMLYDYYYGQRSGLYGDRGFRTAEEASARFNGNESGNVFVVLEIENRY